MIKTNKPELDAVIGALQMQRNEAMDAVALLESRLKAQEALTADLQKQLEEAAKPKEGDK